MPVKNEEALREHVVAMLKGGHAHADFETAIKGLSAAARGKRPKGAAHSPWEIVEHTRIAQWDILEFSRDSAHVSPKWPESYWPPTPSPPTPGHWNKTVDALRADLGAMCKLVSEADLFARIPHGDGQTILREALVLADHNAYHLGELVVVRRVLGEWK